MSQERFAHVVGIHRTFMGEIERGETNVSIAIIAQIAKALKLSLSDLFAEVEASKQ